MRRGPGPSTPSATAGWLVDYTHYILTLPPALTVQVNQSDWPGQGPGGWAGAL